MTGSGHGTTRSRPVAGMAGAATRGMPHSHVISRNRPWRVRAVAASRNSAPLSCGAMRKILVVVAALAMIGGACGSDSNKKADTVGESDATTTTVAGSSSSGDNSSASGDLKAKLLTVGDLPAGYKVSEDDGSDDSEDDS